MDSKSIILHAQIQIKLKTAGNETITELWGYGMTDIHKVYDADGHDFYFKVYLSDIDFIDGDEDFDVVDKL